MIIWHNSDVFSKLVGQISIDSTRSRKKEPTEEFCVESETMSDISLPMKIQTRPKKATEGITAEFSVDENCPGDAINKNVTEAVEDRYFNPL